MRKSQKISWLVVLAATLALILGGCAGKPKDPPGNAIKNELKGAPDWVTNCSSFWKDKDDVKICGVGSMGSTRNIGLAKSAAEGRGRTAIARALQVQIKSMLEDYQATTTGGEQFGKAASDEQHVVDVAKQVTDMSLSGTENTATWISDSGTYYVLMALDVEKFKEIVDNMTQLSESVRKAVVERADAKFKELDAEIAKERAAKQ